MRRVLRRAVREAGDGGGSILIMATFMLFALGVMLFAFELVMNGELRFAALERNSAGALALAEAGIEEALTPPRLAGALPGVTTFANSLARASAESSGTVAYQGCFSGFCTGSPTIFPILSTATFAGSLRKVRAIEQATFRPGFGLAVFGPTVNFGGAASQFTGDIHAVSSVTFLSYPTSPQCASSTMGKTLLSPEVVAGTTIVLGDGRGRGSSFSPTNCPPGLTIKGNGTIVSECQTFSVTEVAPTSCAVFGGRAVPYHWHPMTPVGMPPADFAAILSQSRLPPGMSVVQATQDGAGVMYAPAGTYAPGYWPGLPSGPVLLIVATQPFCVSASLRAVVPVPPPYPGSCQQMGPGFTYYGASQDASTPLITRFLDWGLVVDDLGRSPHAATFFQAPAAPPNPQTFVCPGDSGNPCGIRYIPALPAIDVSAQGCAAAAFDQANTHDAVICANAPAPPGGVRFAGTRTAPETLVIDNSGTTTRSPLQVTLSASAADISPATPCSRIRFDRYNVGVILAQGDIVLTGSGVFTGFIYTTGTVITQGTMTIRGGIFAANIQGPSGAANAMNSAGTVNFCAAQAADLPLSPQFFTPRTLTWQDVPLNQP